MHFNTFVLSADPLFGRNSPPALLDEALKRKRLKPNEFLTLKHGESFFVANRLLREEMQQQKELEIEQMLRQAREQYDEDEKRTYQKIQTPTGSPLHPQASSLLIISPYHSSTRTHPVAAPPRSSPRPEPSRFEPRSSPRFATPESRLSPLQIVGSNNRFTEEEKPKLHDRVGAALGGGSSEEEDDRVSAADLFRERFTFVFFSSSSSLSSFFVFPFSHATSHLLSLFLISSSFVLFSCFLS